MTLKSMTGFSRCQGANSEAQWTLELRSVNGKNLDLRLRLPTAMEQLDTEFRKRLTTSLARGNVTINLNLKKEQTTTRTELNQEAFKDLLAAAKTASDISGLPMPDLGTLLNTRNILKDVDREEAEDKTEELYKSILQDFNQALSELIKARAEEGANLSTAISEKLSLIKQLTQKAETLEERQPEAIKQKIRQNIDLLKDQTIELDETRLHQEAIMIASKADIKEELDRLIAHVAQAEELIVKNEPVGRRLDFLCQEFNREANTICSKANAKELTYIGLELKTVIDQLREQVQNIE